MSKDDDIAFLRYFFRSYIPPFIESIRETKEKYEKVYLSSYEVWWNLRLNFDRLPLPKDIKKI